MHQLTETAITISHYAHTLIAKNLKKSYAILDRFLAFHKILHGLATQYMIYDFLNKLNKIYMFNCYIIKLNNMKK